jgi:hypothetical protein
VYSMDAGARASRSVQQQFWALALHEIQFYLVRSTFLYGTYHQKNGGG